MNEDAATKLLAIFVVVAGAWIVGRLRWLGAAPHPDLAHVAGPGRGVGVHDPARVLANSAFYIFIPALLCLTTARLDMATLPWRTLLAYFVPVQVLLFGLYGFHRHRQRRRPDAPAALPTVRTITSIFGNTAQVGIPIVTALYGAEGLGLHVTVMGLHGLTLLSTLTVLVEMDLATARVRDARAPSIAAMALTTLRNTIVHPVVLPLLVGWLWNLSGVPMPAVIEDVLELLSLGVVPVSLVVIGLSLAYYGLAPRLAPSVGFVVIKLLLQPAFVLLVAHWGFGLSGLPLSIVVLMGALPVGANALIFAQRYQTHEAESATAIVISTFCYAVTLPFWLFVLGLVPR
jgi:malonate transporter and related proteins